MGHQGYKNFGTRRNANRNFVLKNIFKCTFFRNFLLSVQIHLEHKNWNNILVKTASTKWVAAELISSAYTFYHSAICCSRLEEMVNPISLLIESFPWIREMFQEVLSLETTVAFLKNGESYFQLFDISGILKKMVFFWAEVCRKRNVSSFNLCFFQYGVKSFAFRESKLPNSSLAH